MMIKRERIIAEEFSLLELPTLDPERKAERLTRLAKTIAMAADHGAISAASITRKREFADLDGEILRRPKGPVNDMTNTTAPAVCEVIGCINRWSIRCPLFMCGKYSTLRVFFKYIVIRICNDKLLGRYICGDHKPEDHAAHVSFGFKNRQVEEAIILKPIIDAKKAKAEAKAKAMVRCDCGASIQKRGMKSHIKSAGHKAWLEGGRQVPASSEPAEMLLAGDNERDDNSTDDDDDDDT